MQGSAHNEGEFHKATGQNRATRGYARPPGPGKFDSAGGEHRLPLQLKRSVRNSNGISDLRSFQKLVSKDPSGIALRAFYKQFLEDFQGFGQIFNGKTRAAMHF